MTKEGRPTLGHSVPLHLVRNLIFALEEALGEDSVETLGYLGYRLGSLVFSEAKTPSDLMRLGAENGIGFIDIVTVSDREMRIGISECIGCSGMAEYNESISAFEAGIVRGAAEALTGRHCDVVETHCCTSGWLKCEFNVVIV
jgi:predicted hydrocarbon binding protein